MELTPNLRLPYPDDNDPGDGALDLQVFAEATDAAITAQLAALKTNINKPCRVAMLNTPTAGFASGLTVDVFAQGTWTIIYDSSSIVGTTLDPFTQRGMGEEPGIYHLGAYIVTQPTGAVTVNSLRRLQVQATVPSDRTVFPATTQIFSGISTGYETGVSVHPLVADIEIYTPFPAVGVSTSAGTVFNAFYTHQNTGSTVQILNGSLAWIWRAGDVEVI